METPQVSVRLTQEEVARFESKKGSAHYHDLIDRAIANRHDAQRWESLRNALKRAAEMGELTFSVRRRFCLNCPTELGYAAEVSRYHVPERRDDTPKPSPLKAHKKPLTVEEKLQRQRRVEENRALRLAAQPSKGSGGSGGKKGGDKKKK